MNLDYLSFQFQGTSHKKKNLPCQDAINIFKDEDFFVFCVCDGAGGYKDIPTEIGSKLISETFIEVVYCYQDLLLSGDYKTILTYTLEGAKAALNKSINLKTLTTTLSAICFYQEKCYGFQIGDGLVFLRKNTGIELFLDIQKGLFANETICINSKQGIEQACFRVCNAEDITGFVLMSDGLEPVFSKRQEPFLPTFNALFHGFATLEKSKLKSELATFFQSRQVLDVVDDDISIICGVKI